MRQNDTLTRNQQRALNALLSNPTIEAAAQEVGLNRRTLERWMNDPNFDQALKAELGETKTHALRRLSTGLDEALDAIYQIMTDNGNAASKRGAATRLRAATTWVEFIAKLSDLNTEERLSRLEEAVFYGNAK